MQGWAAANPRVAGVFVIVVGLGLAAMNLAMLVYSSRYYPMLFPIAGACAAAGSLQAITGIRADHGSPLSHRVPAIVVAILGMVLGAGANYLLTGSVF